MAILPYQIDPDTEIREPRVIEKRHNQLRHGDPGGSVNSGQYIQRDVALASGLVQPSGELFQAGLPLKLRPGPLGHTGLDQRPGRGVLHLTECYFVGIQLIRRDPRGILTRVKPSRMSPDLSHFCRHGSDCVVSWLP